MSSSKRRLDSSLDSSKRVRIDPIHLHEINDAINSANAEAFRKLIPTLMKIDKQGQLEVTFTKHHEELKRVGKESSEKTKQMKALQEEISQLNEKSWKSNRKIGEMQKEMKETSSAMTTLGSRVQTLSKNRLAEQTTGKSLNQLHQEDCNWRIFKSADRQIVEVD